MFNLAARAKASGDKNKRRKLLDQAHRTKDLHAAAERRLAEGTFKRMNRGYGLNQMDLHGLRVKEALEQVLRALHLFPSTEQINDSVGRKMLARRKRAPYIPFKGGAAATLTRIWAHSFP